MGKSSLSLGNLVNAYTLWILQFDMVKHDLLACRLPLSLYLYIFVDQKEPNSWYKIGLAKNLVELNTLKHAKLLVNINLLLVASSFVGKFDLAFSCSSSNTYIYGRLSSFCFTQLYNHAHKLQAERKGPCFKKYCTILRKGLYIQF